jgi:hypothetical protein
MKTKRRVKREERGKGGVMVPFPLTNPFLFSFSISFLCSVEKGRKKKDKKEVKRKQKGLL